MRGAPTRRAPVKAQDLPGHRDLRADDPGRGGGGRAADALRPAWRLRLPLLLVRHDVCGRPRDRARDARRLSGEEIFAATRWPRRRSGVGDDSAAATPRSTTSANSSSAPAGELPTVCGRDPGLACGGIGWPGVDRLTVSPKPPSSGMATARHEASSTRSWSRP